MWFVYAAVALLVFEGVRTANKHVRARRKRLRGPVVNGKSAYDIIGVDYDATPANIRRAYHAAMRRHHPDRMIDASDEERAEAEQRCKELNAAYAALSS